MRRRPWLIRRRINDNGIDVQHCCITANLTQSPFLRNVANPITVIAWPIQGNSVTQIGDLPMGSATALAVGVGSITIISPGSGYAAAPVISFTGGCVTEPTATATVLNGGVASITVTAPGSGCVSPPTVVFTGANTSPAIATATLTSVGGGTGVTYETSTGRSCVAGSVPSTGLALLGAPPAATLEGFVACATFSNDVTISSNAGSSLFFTLQAGTTQTATGTLGSPGITVIPLGTGGSAPQLVSVTNPNQLAHPITLIGPDYKPSAATPPTDRPRLRFRAATLGCLPALRMSARAASVSTSR